jgi:hypothetical protein
MVTSAQAGASEKWVKKKNTVMPHCLLISSSFNKGKTEIYLNYSQNYGIALFIWHLCRAIFVAIRASLACAAPWPKIIRTANHRENSPHIPSDKEVIFRKCKCFFR